MQYIKGNIYGCKIKPSPKNKKGIIIGTLLGVTISEVHNKYDTACLKLKSGHSYICMLYQIIKA